MSEPHDTTTLPPAPQGNGQPPAGDGYEILGELGRGGVGVVYKVRDRRLNRVVALKVLLSGIHATQSELSRFHTEAEALARLQHPNIVQIFEVGEHNGLRYFTMEFCGGGTLADVLRESPLPPRAAAGLIETLARAVQAAHAAHVVHRDLKPGNVLLANAPSLALRAGDQPEAPARAGPDLGPKITDFGLSRRLDDVSRTQTGAILGTPSYMAPEQAEARKDVGPPADVWALGAILYECLTGRPPFKAATAFDTLVQVLGQDPAPPSQLNAGVPRDLETIALKCLQKPIARRYASAQELADDLGRYLTGEPIRARPTGRAERAWRWCKRNRAVAASLLAVALSLVGAAVVSAVYAVEATRQRDLAVDEKRKAEESEARSRRLVYGGQVNLARQAWEDDRSAYAAALLSVLPEEYRGFEWRWLHRLAHSSPLEVRGLGVDGVAGERLAVSPDGRWIVVGGKDLWILDAATGRAHRRLTDHAPRQIAGVALSRDGKLLAAAEGHPGEKDPRVSIRAMPTGEKLGEVAPGRLAAAFGPDGEAVAVLSGSDDNSSAVTVRLVEWRTGRERWRLTDPTFEPRAVVLDPAGRSFAAAGDVYVPARWAINTVWSGEFLPFLKRSPAELTGVRLLDLATGQARAVGPAEAPAFRLSYGPDGKRLAAWTGGEARLIDVSSGQMVLRRTLDGVSGYSGVAFGKHGRVALGTGESVRVLSEMFGGPEVRLGGGGGTVVGVAWTPDGRLASLAQGGLLLVRDALEQEGRTFHYPGGGHGHSVSPLPGGEHAVTLVHKTVKRVSLRAGKPDRTYRRLFDLERGMMTGFAVSRDGRRVAGVRVHPVDIDLYDVSGQLLRVFPGDGQASSASLSHDGRLLARRTAGQVTIFDADSGERLGAVALPGARTTLAEFTVAGDTPLRNGETLFVARQDKEGGLVSVLGWDVGSRFQYPVGAVRVGDLLSLAVTGDGKVAVGGSESSVTIDLGTGEWTRVETGRVSHAAFSPNGDRLATAAESQRGTVALWDVGTGQQVGRLPCDLAVEHGLAFSPDGLVLVASGRPGVDDAIRVWDARPLPGRIVRDVTKDAPP